MTLRSKILRRRDAGEPDTGAVLVELALVLPILVMLLIGIIQFGLAYGAYVSIEGAAREGARCLALNQNDCTVANAIANSQGDASNVSYTIVQSCPATPSATSTAYATVTVTATYTFSIPFVNLGTKTLTSTASMRCGL